MVLVHKKQYSCEGECGWIGQGDHLCHCGCRGLTKWFRGKPYRFINSAHYYRSVKHFISCECGWNSELEQPHQCHCGCDKPTKIYTWHVNRIIRFHSVASVTTKRNCRRCNDMNWLIECGCYEHDIISLRDERGRKKHYSHGHGYGRGGGGRPTRWTLPLEDRVRIAWYKEDRKNNTPKPALCQRCNLHPALHQISVSGKYHYDISDRKWICDACKRFDEGWG